MIRAALVHAALTASLIAGLPASGYAQDRMPPIPPEKLTDAQKKAGEEFRAKAQQHRKDVLSRFDKDGDGKLGESERQELHGAWEKFILAQPEQKPAAK